MDQGERKIWDEYFVRLKNPLRADAPRGGLKTREVFVGDPSFSKEAISQNRPPPISVKFTNSDS